MPFPTVAAEGVVPPSIYANTYAAGPEVCALVGAAARWVISVIRSRREIRMLNRIGVLPADWDRTGRHVDR